MTRYHRKGTLQDGTWCKEVVDLFPGQGIPPDFEPDDGESVAATTAGNCVLLCSFCIALGYEW